MGKATAALSRLGSISIAGISPNGEEGQTECKTAATPVWRRDPQSRRLCDECGLFFAHVLLTSEALISNYNTDFFLAPEKIPQRHSTSIHQDGRDEDAEIATVVALRLALETKCHLSLIRGPLAVSSRNSMTSAARLPLPTQLSPSVVVSEAPLSSH